MYVHLREQVQCIKFYVFILRFKIRSSELESRKTQLLEEEERLQIQLAAYEKQLLEELADSEGNILENKTLIDSLNQTKIQSSQIEKALTESKGL